MQPSFSLERLRAVRQERLRPLHNWPRCHQKVKNQTIAHRGRRIARRPTRPAPLGGFVYRTAEHQVGRATALFASFTLSLMNRVMLSITRRNGSFSGSALPLVQRSSALLRRSLGSVQATNSGSHAAGQERQHGNDNGGTGFVYAGLAQLLRLL